MRIGVKKDITYCAFYPLMNWPERVLVSRGGWKHDSALPAVTVIFPYSTGTSHDVVGAHVMQLGTELELQPSASNVP